MFEDFFGFRTKPFGKTPDPAFLFESAQHREALARLEYAVEEKDLALLVGDIGSGKTMLSRALMDRIGDARPVVLLINPRLTPTQLLRSIASGLGMSPSRFRNELLDQIHTKLFELYEAKREPVLIIDEAQLVPSKATFDEIRLLTNFQLDDQNLLSVLLIGQGSTARTTRRSASASAFATASALSRSRRPSHTSSIAFAWPAARATRSRARRWSASTPSAEASRA